MKILILRADIPGPKTNSMMDGTLGPDTIYIAGPNLKYYIYLHFQPNPSRTTQQTPFYASSSGALYFTRTSSQSSYAVSVSSYSGYLLLHSTVSLSFRSRITCIYVKIIFLSYFSSYSFLLLGLIDQALQMLLCFLV